MNIELRNVAKWFGSRYVLRVDRLRIRRGELLVVGGPNGAGKSVMLKLLAGVTELTQGDVLWDGRSVEPMLPAYKFRVGYMPQQPTFYEDHTVDRFLRYFAQLKLIPRRLIGSRVAEVMERLHLTSLAQRRTKQLSGGERSRLALGVALLNDPDLLLLDEPGAHLDHHERVELWSLLADLKLDRIVALATHVYSGLEGIADRLFVLDNGEPLWDEALESLLAKTAPYVWYFTGGEGPNRIGWPEEAIVVRKGWEGSHRVWRVIASQRPCAHAVHATPTLEDAYLWLRWQTGRNCTERG